MNEEEDVVVWFLYPFLTLLAYVYLFLLASTSYDVARSQKENALKHVLRSWLSDIEVTYNCAEKYIFARALLEMFVLLS